MVCSEVAVRDPEIPLYLDGIARGKWCSQIAVASETRAAEISLREPRISAVPLPIPLSVPRWPRSKRVRRYRPGISNSAAPACTIFQMPARFGWPALLLRRTGEVRDAFQRAGQ